MCYARRQRSSWARIKLSKKFYIRCLSAFNIFSSYFILALLLVWVVFSINSDEISIFRTCNALYFSLVVQFSMTVTTRSCGQPCYYTTALCLCQYLFSIFLKNFSTPQFHVISRFFPTPQRWACPLYRVCFLLSRPFKNIFLQIKQIYTYICSHNAQKQKKCRVRVRKSH